MNTQKVKTSWPKLLTLVVISTLMAELLSGSTPLSRINQLPLQFLIYGSGAILVREFTRRFGLGWKTILLLGFAFGLILEGLTLQSIFNPHFLGLDITLGRALGVNWVWAEYLTGLHCFLSISGAILVSEIIYHKDRNEPWVSLTGLGVTGGIYLLISVAFHFIFIKISGFKAPGIPFLCCALAAIAVIVFALRLSPEPVFIRNDAGGKPAYSFWVIAAITCAAGACWFMGIGMIFMKPKISLWIAVPSGYLVLIVYFLLLKKWGLMKIRDTRDKLAVATGILASDLLLGYTGTTTNKVDHYGQIGLIVLVFVLLYMLSQKLKRKNQLATI
jgi:hypothetical protein